MKELAFIFLLSWSFCAAAQTSIPENPNFTDANGLRQGWWTICYYKDWKEVKKPDSIFYYRLLEYRDDKPIGLVKDYYKSGSQQWEGFLISDRPKEIIDTTKAYVYYSESGERLRQIITMHPNVTDAKGLRQGWWTIELDGNMMRPASKEDLQYYRVIEFKDDKPIGITKDYYIQGRLYQTLTLSSFHPAGERGYLQKVDYSQPYHVYWEDGRENQIAVNRIQCERLMSEGKFELAIPSAEKALRATENELGKLNWRYAYFLKVLGDLHLNLGRYTKAEHYIIESIKIREALGIKGVTYVQELVPLAYLYYLMGNYVRSEELYKECLKRAEETIGKESLLYADALNNIAMVYSFMGNNSKASTTYEECLKLKEKLIGKDHFASDGGYIVTLFNYGCVLISQGRYAKAEPIINQALAGEEKLVGKENGTYASMLSYLASLYARTGHYTRAEFLYQDILRISEKVQGKNHPYYCWYLMGLAYTYGAEKNYVKAEPYALAAKEGYLQQIGDFFPALSEFEKEAFYQNVRFFFEGFNSFCLLRRDKNPSILGEMYNNQLATKALLLNSSSKWKQRIRNSGDKKLFSLYSDWEANKGTLAKLSKEKNANQFRIDSLEKLANAQEKELSRRSEMFATIAEKRANTWQEVKAKLKPNEAAVEMIRVRKFGVSNWVTDSSDTKLPRYPIFDLTDTVYYAALIVTPYSHNPELVLIKNGNELETKQLKYYSNSIRNQQEDKSSYGKFWKPIAERLNKLYVHKPSNGIHVYFSPDGVYNQINLNTLLNPSTGNFLLDEVQLRLVTNTKDLLLAKKEEVYNNLAYLFGYPDYGVSAEERNKIVKKERASEPLYYSLALERGNSLSELPGTKTEVETVAQLMTKKGWTPEVLIESKALEETLKDCFKPRVLHIATHGYFQPDTSGKINPLLRSGLMLTGAAQTLEGKKDDRSEDGILTAYEAMNLNLDNTDLVVLSACETGLGEIRNGEGVYGLQRAFKVAGAKTIIMSLWKVNDEATQELMTAFYEYWLATDDKQAAFVNAQEKLRIKYHHPYYWGAFVMVE